MWGNYDSWRICNKELFAIQNKPVEELNMLYVESKNKGHIIKVRMFPFRFKTIDIAAARHSPSQELKDFWESLSIGFFYFEKNRILPKLEFVNQVNYKVKS